MKMTSIPGVPSRDQIRSGMAFYIGTGPKGAVCGNCKHKGYYDNLNVFRDGCAMYRKMAGRHGAAINKEYRACKYYEQQTDASRPLRGCA
jgi:hypothetical protein